MAFSFRRIQDNIERLQTRAEDEARASVLKRHLEPSPLASVLQTFDLNRPVVLEQGVIQDVIPFLKCYRVALQAGPIIICTYGMETHASVVGVNSGTTLPPGITVWVIRIPGAQYGVIIGCEPDHLTIYGSHLAEEFLQAANVGIIGNKAYQTLIQGQPPGGGGIRAWKGAHADALPGDWFQATKTGLAFFLDQFMLGLRVNDYCGVWGNYLDSLLRIAGYNYQLWTGGSEDASYVSGTAIWKYHGYTYGLTGQCGARYYSAGTGMTTVPSDLIQNPYSRLSNIEHITVLNGETATHSRFPVHDVQQWEGILGQGGLRWAFAERYGTQGWMQAPTVQYGATADGSFLIKAKKSIVILKYPFISAPVKMADPDEDIYSSNNLGSLYSQFETYANSAYGFPWPVRNNLIESNPLDLANIVCNWHAFYGFRVFNTKFSYTTERVISALEHTSLKFVRSVFAPAIICLDQQGDISLQNCAGASISLLDRDIHISAPRYVYIDGGAGVKLYGKNIYNTAEHTLQYLAKNTATIATADGMGISIVSQEESEASPGEGTFFAIRMTGTAHISVAHIGALGEGQCVDYEAGPGISVAGVQHLSSRWYPIQVLAGNSTMYSQSEIVTSAGPVPGVVSYSGGYADCPADYDGSSDISSLIPSKTYMISPSTGVYYEQ